MAFATAGLTLLEILGIGGIILAIVGWALLGKTVIRKDLYPNIPEHQLGSCRRCGTSWKWVRGHSTSYGTEGKGCFPLCEDCWAVLTPQERLPYYLGFRDWEEIREAVLRGE